MIINKKENKPLSLNPKVNDILKFCKETEPDAIYSSNGASLSLSKILRGIITLKPNGSGNVLVLVSHTTYGNLFSDVCALRKWSEDQHNFAQDNIGGLVFRCGEHGKIVVIGKSGIPKNEAYGIQLTEYVLGDDTKCIMQDGVTVLEFKDFSTIDLYADAVIKFTDVVDS